MKTTYKPKQRIHFDDVMRKQDIQETKNITGLKTTQIEESLKEGICHSQLRAGKYKNSMFVPFPFKEAINQKRLNGDGKMLK